MDPWAPLDTEDPEIGALVHAEEERTRSNLELIASESYPSLAVLQAVGSILTGKYAEGYPGRRYYGGCEFVDMVEELARSPGEAAVRRGARQRPAACRGAGEHGGLPRAACSAATPSWAWPSTRAAT